MAEISEVRLQANGVEFSCLTIGDGPLALCLHGFPDSAHTWRHLMPRLAAAGYRAVAPFMRGYLPTAVPTDACYQTGALAVDANELHAAVGGGSDAVIIGHDWGASATAGAAVLAPEQWSKVVMMAVPPGSALAMALLTNLEQVKRSWYMFFFQHALADMVVPANDLAYIDMLWADWSPGYDAAVDLGHVKDCLHDPANLGAALGYYRTALGDGCRNPAFDDAQAAAQLVPPQPLLYLHGANDGCIGAEVAEAARPEMAANGTVEIIDDCGHFLHLERPDVVNDRIIEFLT